MQAGAFSLPMRGSKTREAAGSRSLAPDGDAMQLGAEAFERDAALADARRVLV
jgi:hypothetical protein